MVTKKKTTKKVVKSESGLTSEEEQDLIASLNEPKTKKVESQISQDEMSMFKETLSNEISTKIVKAQEYFVSSKILRNLQKVESDAVKKHGWENFYSAISYFQDAEKEIVKENICFFVPTSLITRIENLEKALETTCNEFNLLVKFNGTKISNLSGKEFFSFYSKLLNKSDFE